MKTRTVIILVILASLLAFAAGWLAYPYLPDRIATHWDASGNVNGYSSRNFILTFNPILILGLGLFMLFIPRLDPLRANLTGFRGLYHVVIVVFAGFILYLQVAILLLNLGWQANILNLLLPAFAVLFFMMGMLVDKARRNWFIGIRTPWTLSNDLVWEKTHHLGGRLFKLSAVICLLGVFLPQMAFFFMVVPPLSVSLILVVYSYVIYQTNS